MASKIEVQAWVILRKDKHMKLVQIKPRQKEYIAKVQFSFDGAIGHHFGTSFEIVKGQLTKVDPAKLLENVANEPENVDEPSENGEKSLEKNSAPSSASSSAAASQRQDSPSIDNRNLYDRDENQRLGRDDIVELRAQGARGHEIIGHLVNNSLTFKGKTEYSREKYVNRKKKKHISLLVVLKPSTRLLCEMYYSKKPVKLCGLRLDTLTQMLLHGNVRAGANLMIVDSALGMVVGAAMERMGGVGRLVHLFAGSAPQIPAYVGLDFPASFNESYYEFPLDRVKELFDGDDADDLNGDVPAEKGKADDDAAAAKEKAEVAEENENEGAVKETEENGTETSMADEAGSKSVVSSKDKAPEEDAEEKEDSPEGCLEPPKKKFRRDADDLHHQKRRLRADRQNHTKDMIREKEMDGLIFCSRFHPTPIVVKLIQFVAPSRPVVIFNQFREPLIDLYSRFKNTGNVVNLKLSESWMREYQVLPGRTHPLMQMSGGGGYLLTGYVVDTS